MEPAVKDHQIERTEAERIAKEYQDFAYIVSHDLNAPLRHVKEFTRLLIGAREDGLNSEEQEYVSLLESSLRKLDNMQQGLLAFSRINTTDPEIQDVDLNQIVANVVNSLEGEISNINVSFDIGELPTLRGDQKQLHSVFYNLLDNAIKFHEQNAERKVSVSCEENAGGHQFCIQDNGIGIKPDFHGEVFRIFRKLHAGDAFPGFGTGLTIAQKIIERHGGKMWIESEPEKGTTVFFTHIK